jgi:hypothetical protein
MKGLTSRIIAVMMMVMMGRAKKDICLEATNARVITTYVANMTTK